MTTSRVPAVIDTLVEFFTNAVITLGEPRVEVVDGAPSHNPADLGRDVVIVGVNIFDQLAVTGTRAGEGMQTNDIETFQVGVAFSSIRGVGETKQARDRVAAMLALIEAKLEQDMTLGGVIGQARVGPSFVWSQQQVLDEEIDGVQVMARVDVGCLAVL